MSLAKLLNARSTLAIERYFRLIGPEFGPMSPTQVVELIGGGGKIEEVLGELPTYRDASTCSLRWSDSYLDDLRLTRERKANLNRQRGPLP